MRTPQQIAQRWSTGIAGAGQAYKDGIQGVTENPMAKAAANLDKAAARYQDAVSSGRMAASLNAVPVAFWKTQCSNGASKLTSSGTKGAPKMEKFAKNATPIWQGMKAAAASAPDDPKAKFGAAIDVLMAAKGTLKGY